MPVELEVNILPKRLSFTFVITTTLSPLFYKSNSKMK
jgi:hypothetical protein